MKLKKILMPADTQLDSEKDLGNFVECMDTNYDFIQELISNFPNLMDPYTCRVPFLLYLALNLGIEIPMAEAKLSKDVEADAAELELVNNGRLDNSGSVYVGDDLITYTNKEGTCLLTGTSGLDRKHYKGESVIKPETVSKQRKIIANAVRLYKAKGTDDPLRFMIFNIVGIPNKVGNINSYKAPFRVGNPRYRLVNQYDAEYMDKIGEENDIASYVAHPEMFDPELEVTLMWGDANGVLVAATQEGDHEVQINNTMDFPESGIVWVGDEIFKYDQKSDIKLIAIQQGGEWDEYRTLSLHNTSTPVRYFKTYRINQVRHLIMSWCSGTNYKITVGEARPRRLDRSARSWLTGAASKLGKSLLWATLDQNFAGNSELVVVRKGNSLLAKAGVYLRRMGSSLLKKRSTANRLGNSLIWGVIELQKAANSYIGDWGLVLNFSFEYGPDGGLPTNWEFVGDGSGIKDSSDAYLGSWCGKVSRSGGGSQAYYRTPSALAISLEKGRYYSYSIRFKTTIQEGELSIRKGSDFDSAIVSHTVQAGEADGAWHEWYGSFFNSFDTGEDDCFIFLGYPGSGSAAVIRFDRVYLHPSNIADRAGNSFLLKSFGDMIGNSKPADWGVVKNPKMDFGMLGENGQLIGWNKDIHVNLSKEENYNNWTAKIKPFFAFVNTGFYGNEGAYSDPFDPIMETGEEYAISMWFILVSTCSIRMGLQNTSGGWIIYHDSTPEERNGSWHNWSTNFICPSNKAARVVFRVNGGYGPYKFGFDAVVLKKV